MTALTTEEKNYIRRELKSLLIKDDTRGIREKLTALRNDSEISGSKIFAFILENDIDLFSDTDTIDKNTILYQGLERIKIPSHIRHIADGAFKNLSNLLAVSFEDGVESIGKEAFAETGIKSIKIPKTVNSIGNGAFKNCASLKQVVLPETVTKLSHNLFDGTPDDIVVYTNSRKDLPIDKQLRCSEEDIEWYKQHLKINTDYLYEKYKLKEAWSPSTPDWLKPRLNRLAKSFDDFNYKGKPRGDIYDYKIPRDSDRRSYKDLYSILRSKDFDFETIEFIEGEVPSSKTDERLKLPNVGVWHFPNGQVYIQDVNVLEKYDEVKSDYYGKNFGAMPFKMLKTEADAFCYFNVNQPEKKDYKALKDSRDEWGDWLGKSGNTYARKADKKQKGVYMPWYDDESYDKSGFKPVPSSEKYAKELRRIHAKDYAKELENFELRLKRAFVTIQQDILSELSWDDDVNAVRTVRQDIMDILSKYNDALSQYKNMLRKIEIYKSQYGEDSDEFISHLTSTSYDEYGWYKDGCKSTLKDLEEFLRKYKKVYLDF